jgi:hypothetical protein
MPRIERLGIRFAGHADARCTRAGRAVANSRLPALQHGLQRQGEMRRPSARRFEGDHRVRRLGSGGRAACAGRVAVPLHCFLQQGGTAAGAGFLLDHHYESGICALPFAEFNFLGAEKKQSMCGL